VTSPRSPVPAARLGVGLATRTLPSRTDRERYRAEFLAELTGMPASAQWRYTAGVLSHALALRAALGGASSPVMKEDAMQQTVTFGRRFRCRVLRWHDWQTHSTEDGGRYRSCSVCHRDHPGPLGMDNTIGA
jgi:hypothetical protein